jgi:hypothetical protein
LHYQHSTCLAQRYHHKAGQSTASDPGTWLRT